jgi:hypothetical protein
MTIRTFNIDFKDKGNISIAKHFDDILSTGAFPIFEGIGRFKFDIFNFMAFR